MALPQTQSFFFFLFFIGNEKKFIKKKLACPSSLEMYCGGKNQEPKLQWSSKARREKQEKCDKATLQIRRVCKNKDLISNKDHPHPSKHPVFLSLQIHHIKQCGTSLQKTVLRCHPNLPCQDSNSWITSCGITQWSPNKQNTKDHSSKIYGNAWNSLIKAC